MCTKNGNLMGNMTINRWIGIAYVQGKKHLVHKVGGAGHQLLKGSDHPTFFAPSIQIYLAPQGTPKKLHGFLIRFAGLLSKHTHRPVRIQQSLAATGSELCPEVATRALAYQVSYQRRVVKSGTREE